MKPPLVVALGVIACTPAVVNGQESEPPLRFVEARQLRHVFGDLRSVAVDRHGRVFAADGQALVVWQFDGGGELADSIGRQGEGPGEFESLDNIQSLGDTLYTFDATLQRLTAFPTSNGPRGSVRTMSFRGRRGVVSAWVNPADRSIVYSAKAPIVTGWEVTQDRTTVHRAPGDALLVESYGDSLLHMPIDERLITVRPGVFGMTEPMPFGRSSIIRLGPDGTIYHLWTGQLDIFAYGPNGGLAYTVPLPGHVSRAVSSQDIDRLLASVREHPAPPAVRDANLRRIESARDENRLSSHWPVATDFVVDERGRLWVVLVTERDMIRRTDIGGHRYSYAPPDGGGRSLAVFDPESRTWRTGSLPVEGELVAVQNGQVHVLTTDELGVQFIRVFRIE